LGASSRFVERDVPRAQEVGMPPLFRRRLRVLSAAVALVAASVASAAGGEGSPRSPAPDDVHPLSRFVASHPEYPTAALRLHRFAVRTLRGADVHRYSLALRRGEFAAVRVEQRVGNLAVVVFDPDGAPLTIVDENGAGQAEVVTIDAAGDGVYTLQLAMYEWDSPDARYAIGWHVRERTQATPSARAAQLFAAWYAADRPGAAVTVQRDGTPLFAAARGLADAERRASMSEHTRVDLASVSKQFTAYAIALLAAHGDVSLDDDVRRWLPELPDYGAAITLRHLLEHRSGLRDWDAMFGLAGRRIEDGISADDVLAMVVRQRGLVFAPGSERRYSNTGYVLLALVVERATGTPFDRWMADHVFRPLGMHECGFSRRRVPLADGAAASYVASYPAARVVTRERLVTVGSSSLECSVHDLRRWLANYAGPTLGGPSVRALVTDDGTKHEPDAPAYVFGRWFSARDGVASVGHQGLAAGFRTSVRSFPERHLDMIYLANDGNDATYGRITRLENLFLGIQEPPLEIPTAEYTPPRRAAVSPKDVAALAGTYASTEADVRVDVREGGGGLVLVHRVLGTIPLAAQDADAYTSTLEFLPRLEFVRDARDRAAAFDVVGEDVGRLRFERVD
jgi:CubicO group peptidase (beta-lactamase class C family)